MTTPKLIVDLNEILGLAEIASHFDLSYSTALSWTRSRGFPAPIRTFKMGPAWLLSDIQDWKKTANTRRRAR
jgi:predicted DNA-binding transcriptional regulator AlpA